MGTESAANKVRSSRLLSSKKWTRSWLFIVGGWVVLFSSWWFGAILGELLSGWFGTFAGPEWVEFEQGAGFVLFLGASFLFLAGLDRRYGERLPVLANRPEPFEWVSFVIFVFAMFGWFVTSALLANAVATFGDRTVEIVVGSGSLLLFLLAATTFLIHVSR